MQANKWRIGSFAGGFVLSESFVTVRREESHSIHASLSPNIQVGEPLILYLTLKETTQ